MCAELSKESRGVAFSKEEDKNESMNQSFNQSNKSTNSKWQCFIFVAPLSVFMLVFRVATRNLTQSHTLCRLNRTPECNERRRCDGFIDCEWLTHHDEVNCSECTFFRPIRCDCNQEGNFTCEWDGEGEDLFTCYSDTLRGK